MNAIEGTADSATCQDCRGTGRRSVVAAYVNSVLGIVCGVLGVTMWPSEAGDDYFLPIVFIVVGLLNFVRFVQDMTDRECRKCNGTGTSQTAEAADEEPADTTA